LHTDIQTGDIVVITKTEQGNSTGFHVTNNGVAYNRTLARRFLCWVR